MTDRWHKNSLLLNLLNPDGSYICHQLSCLYAKRTNLFGAGLFIRFLMARSTHFSSLELPKSALSYAGIFIRFKRKEKERKKLTNSYCSQDKNLCEQHVLMNQHCHLVEWLIYSYTKKSHFYSSIHFYLFLSAKLSCLKAYFDQFVLKN